MKILSYSLFCFIFCFLGLCDDEEDDCTKLDKEITVKIYSQIFDDTGTQCENTFAVDFYKDHCGGGPSGQMSYIHEGCYTDELNLTYVRKEGIGVWDITFNYEKDMLNVNIVHSNSKISSGSISGREIYKLTNGGSSNIIITGRILNNKEISIGFWKTY